MPISFTVREPGGIRGVLLDERGAPVEGELVHAIAAVHAGTSQDVPVERVRTRVDGRFSSRRFRAGSTSSSSTLTIVLNRRSSIAARTTPARECPAKRNRDRRRAPIVDAGTFRVPPDPVERTITGVVLWSDGVPASDAELVLHGAAPERVPLDPAGRFRLTLAYGARFTLRVEGRREVNGRVRESASESTEIGRNNRNRELQLVLPVPQ